MTQNLNNEISSNTWDNIRVFFISVDALTDGIIDVPSVGPSSRSFCLRDFWALKILEEQGYRIYVISDKIEPCVYSMCEDRNIRVFEQPCGYLDIENWFKQEEEQYGNYFEWENVAYIGSSEVDYSSLERAAFAACPQDAIPEILKIDLQLVAPVSGGRGAICWVVKEFLAAKGVSLLSLVSSEKDDE